nr:hypothetical protein [uncultured Lichenicoccus sp.]
MRHQPAPALLAILAVLSLLWPRAAVTALSSYDQRFYLGIAYDLRQHGTFTDGFSYAGGGPDTIRPPGMRFAPLYPVLLAATAGIDPGLHAGIACVEATAGRDAGCPRRAPVIRLMQFAMLAAFYWMLWIATAHALRSCRAAWTGLAIGLLAAPLLLLSVNTLMTETLSLVLSTSACTLAAEALQRPSAGRWRWWAAAGVTLGLDILSRPAFLYLFYASVLCAAAMLLVRPTMRRGVVSAAAAFTAGTALPVLPWIARNAVVLHRPALSFGYASHTLVQRIAFDAMTTREYGLSFVCWLPDGSGLGRLIAGRQACDRFGWDEHPDSFYSIGNGPLMQQTLAASGGWPHHMGYLVQHYLLAEPLRHLLVSIPLALRGMYVNHWWGVLLAPVSVWAMTKAWRSRNWPVLLLSLPAWFLLAFNAVVAVNQPRYNLLLVLPFSLAGALLCERLLASRAGATLPAPVS